MKKFLALILVIAMGLSLVACGKNAEHSKTGEPNTLQQTEENHQEQTAESSAPDSSGQNEEPGDEPNSQVAPPVSQNRDDSIAKISGGADDVGIYSTVVKLTDQAADKGVIEMIYYGAKGSPQEASIVNTFRIEYYKEDAGTFEIETFFNGEVYQNQHHKDEVKVVNTFGATLRAGSVIISYTPDGGETQEIFKADAEYFKASAN